MHSCVSQRRASRIQEYTIDPDRADRSRRWSTDAIEDQGGRPTLAAIRERFGNMVAGIVACCSDSDTEANRKVRYLSHVREAPRSIRLVASADELHNARCVLTDYRAVGEAWQVTEALRRREPEAGDALVEELDRQPTPNTV